MLKNKTNNLVNYLKIQETTYNFDDRRGLVKVFAIRNGGILNSSIQAQSITVIDIIELRL